MHNKKHSLLVKFGIVFLLFVILTLSITGFTTYVNQTRIYQAQQEKMLHSLSDYLSLRLQTEDYDFAQFQRYFLAHADKMEIPIDFGPQDALAAQKEFERLFAKAYPGQVLGVDISFSALSPELQMAYAIACHEHFLLLFEQANKTFGLSYTYYFVPTGEDELLCFVFDGVRERKDGGLIRLGDRYPEPRAAHEKLWEAWETGAAPSGYDIYDNEYGRTYAWYTPLFLGGEKLGLIGTELEIENYNHAIAMNTLRQVASISLILVLASALLLFYIDRKYIFKIRHLSQAVGSYAQDKRAEIADQIKQAGRDELCVLSNQTADMILELDDYMNSLVKTTDELTHTREQVSIESSLARMDALTGVRNRNAYEEEIRRLKMEMQKGEAKFGFAVVDVNFLKHINDTYGHDMGNITICKCCELVCSTFTHSPVFRIGGDEFAVILENQDYEHTEALIRQFNRAQATAAGSPWEKVSAAIGYALYDPRKDDCVENVFGRADKAMYHKKREMKALR